MFRFFLKRKILLGSALDEVAETKKQVSSPDLGSRFGDVPIGSDQKTGQSTYKHPNHSLTRDLHPQSSPIDNRRSTTRYNASHKRLTLLNDQDIFQVSDISTKGFSTIVSPRALQRLVIGDTFEGKVRYLGKSYDLDARVAWKSNQSIGFAISRAAEDTHTLLRRLIVPIALASTLHEVDASFMRESVANGQRWFHGEDEVDIHIWNLSSAQVPQAWRVTQGDMFVEWTRENGIQTGESKSLKYLEVTTAVAGLGIDVTALSNRVVDPKPDADKLQFAVDLLLASGLVQHDHILEVMDQKLVQREVL